LPLYSSKKCLESGVLGSTKITHLGDAPGADAS
jgi:hypothetical protein